MELNERNGNLETGEHDDHHDTILPRVIIAEIQNFLDGEISEVDPAKQMRPCVQRFVGPPKQTAQKQTFSQD